MGAKHSSYSAPTTLGTSGTSGTLGTLDQFLDQLNLPRVIRGVAGDPDDQIEAFGLAKR